ncbi:MAG: tyrosine-type recombinase/integrase [Scytonematopsis contorta HA4267-MV1]|jgi:integrase|nr:tyrosine-type recombinase/integrase [Scytonematopsis contorta HA4267-MV1]
MFHQIDNSQTRQESSVRVENYQGRLRLEFTVEEKKYTVSLGLANTKENWTVAETKANEVKSDITFGHFNPENLDKYRIKGHLRLVNPTDDNRELMMKELWDKYLQFKSQTLKETTIAYMQFLSKYIIKCPIQDINQATEIRQWFLEASTSSISKRSFTHLSACVKWAIKNKLISLSANPFEGMAAELPKYNWQENSQPNAFTEEEKLSIIKAFENHRGNWNGRGYTGFAFSHYAPFVKFLFLTGCRPSEAIGLQWKKVKDDCSQILFDSSIVRIKGKPTRMEGSKNNKTRKFNCNQKLQELLRSVKPRQEKYDPEALVFPSPKGKVINYQNFSIVAWNRIVDNIIERPTTPYSCRDTFISEQIAKGVPTAVVAKWCDNSVEIIEQQYLDYRVLSQLTPL